MKKLKVMILTFIIIIFSIGNSYGADNTYDIIMEQLQTEILAGKIIKIPVKVENITLENGIVAFNTLLSYDEKVLEIEEVLGSHNFKKPNVVENLIGSTTITMQPEIGNQEIMTIVFKVKEDAPIGKTRIALSKFEVSDGENTFINDNTTQITINITSVLKNVREVVEKGIWFTMENVTITFIISILIIIAIILLVIYYNQHKRKEEIEKEKSKKE